MPRWFPKRRWNGWERASHGRRWEAGKELVLEANEQYYEGRPRLDTVVFTIGQTFEQRFAQFLAGNLEEALIPAGKTEAVDADPQYRQYQKLSKPTLGLLFSGFNTQ